MARLYWITGLAGAGKTTIGRLVYEKLKSNNPAVVFLDGDELREVLGAGASYEREERLKLGLQYCRLAKLLVDQSITVVLCTISLFKECHQWNRENFPDYKEIFLKVPRDILLERDQKKLYSGSHQGQVKAVMGVDITFDEPTEPDLVLVNDGAIAPGLIADEILKLR